MRYNYISILRVLACFSIVVAHSICTPVIYYSDLYSSVSINLTIILTIVLRGGVQIFFMISGVLFLDTSKEIEYEKILKKYVRRIVLGIIIFGTAFALMELIFVGNKISLKLLFIAMMNMIQNESWGHLWYLYTLVGLYLITPILKLFISNSSDKDFNLFVAILFVFNILFPFVNQTFNIKIGFIIPFVGAALFYYVLGFAIHFKRIILSNCVCIILIIVEIAVLIYEALFTQTINTNSTKYEFLSNWDLFNGLIPISIFSLFYNFNRKEENKICTFLSPYTYGVYIFHPIFVNFYYKVLKITPIKINILFMDIACIVFSFIGALLIVYMFKKINFIKNYIL